MKNNTVLVAVLMIALVCFKVQSVEEKGDLKNGTISLNNGLVSMNLINEDLAAAMLLISDISEPRDRSRVQPPNAVKSIENWVFHPEVNVSVTLYLSGVPKVDAINRVLLNDTVGKIYTGLKTTDYPLGNVVVVVPFKKLNDFRFQSKFIEISKKTYCGAKAYMRLHQADTVDIFTVLSKWTETNLDLHEVCRERISIRIDELPCDLVLDIICALLDYEMIRKPETGNLSVVRSL